MTEGDRESGFRAFVDAYGGGPKLYESAMEVPLANRWVADDEGRIVGIMRGLPVEQAFGGRFVPSIGVAAVGVALDARSRGVGRELMTGFLRAQHEARMGLSVLYFSTAAPYRGVGYEIAGHRIRYALPLDYLPRKQELPVEPWGEDDLPAVNASLRRFALTQNGVIARPDWWWQTRVFKPLGDDQYLYRFLVRQDGEVRGALIYTIEKGPREDLPVAWVRESEALEVVARDLFWETPEAGRSLLAFAAGQRAMGTDLAWTGPAHDPLALLIPEHAPRFTSGYRWMGRVVHVAAALEARRRRSGEPLHELRDTGHARRRWAPPRCRHGHDGHAGPGLCWPVALDARLLLSYVRASLGRRSSGWAIRIRRLRRRIAQRSPTFVRGSTPHLVAECPAERPPMWR